MEGFSLALLEAQSHGVPSISYNIKYGPGELIIPDYNGSLVEFNNEDQLYETVKALLEEPELQQKYAQNSIESSKIFSKDAIINRWQQLINDINT